MVWINASVSFQENLSQMPEPEDVEKIDVVIGGWRSWFRQKDQVVATITAETPEWFKLFFYVASTMGELNRISAQRAFELLADRGQWVLAHPGQHPALDCLVESFSIGKTYDLKIKRHPIQVDKGSV